MQDQTAIAFHLRPITNGLDTCLCGQSVTVAEVSVIDVDYFNGLGKGASGPCSSHGLDQIRNTIFESLRVRMKHIDTQNSPRHGEQTFAENQAGLRSAGGCVHNQIGADTLRLALVDQFCEAARIAQGTDLAGTASGNFIDPFALGREIGQQSFLRLAATSSSEQTCICAPSKRSRSMFP